MGDTTDRPSDSFVLTAARQGAGRSGRGLVLRRIIRPGERVLRGLRESEVEAFGDLGLRACDLALMAEVGMLLMAYVGEDPVGGCQLVRMFDEPDCLFIVGFYVRPEWQGRSLGASLLEAVIQEARAAGAKSLTLTANPDNISALRLYENAGFVVEESVTDLYGDGAPRHLLRKLLAE